MTIVELHARLQDLREQAKADAGGDWHDSAVSMLGNFIAMTKIRLEKDALP